MPVSMSLVVIASERFADHQTPPGHPESPERAEVMDVIAEEWRKRRGEVVAPRQASREQLARVHSPEHLRRIAETAGISVALGYGVGCLAAWIVRSCGVRASWSARVRRIGWWVLGGLAAVLVPVLLVLGAVWQNYIRDLVDMEHTNGGHAVPTSLFTRWAAA